MAVFKKMFEHVSSPAQWISHPNGLIELVNFGFKLIKNGPKDVKDCSQIVVEGQEVITWTIKHISLTTITTGLLANLLGHIFAIVTDIWGLFSALVSHDFFTLGQDTGDLAMQLLN